MRKIPTLFVRDENERRYVTDTVTPGCEWVPGGEGFDKHVLLRHGTTYWDPPPPRDHAGLREFFTEHPGVEGIVFWRVRHNSATDMAKIKAKDFRP